MLTSWFVTEFWSCLVHISNFRCGDFIKSFLAVGHWRTRLCYLPTIPLELLLQMCIGASKLPWSIKVPGLVVRGGSFMQRRNDCLGVYLGHSLLLLPGPVGLAVVLHIKWKSLFGLKCLCGTARLLGPTISGRKMIRRRSG